MSVHVENNIRPYDPAWEDEFGDGTIDVDNNASPDWEADEGDDDDSDDTNTEIE